MINCFGVVLGCKLLQRNGASIVTVVVSETDRQGGRGRKESFKKNMEFLGKGRVKEHKLWVEPCDNVDQAPTPSLIQKH